MPPSKESPVRTSQSAPPLPHPGASVVDRVLAVFTRVESRDRVRSTWIVVALLIGIGWVDYFTGVRVSLNLFYLVPILLCDNWLGWRAATVSAVASIVFRYVGDYFADPSFVATLGVAMFWNRLVDLAVYIALLRIFDAHIMLRRDLEQRVRQRTVALEQAVIARQQLQTQLFEISRDERSSIGRDLHDGLGQHLTATAMASDVLATRLASESHPATKDAQVIVGLVQDGISKTRQIARGLLLAAIEPDELVSELEELASTVSDEHNVFCRFSLRGRPPSLDRGQASHLFYIAQEAVRNALRHAKPANIEIDLSHNKTGLTLTITDDGVGLPDRTAEPPSGMGLRIMAHRAELIGADFDLSPASIRGTCVRCQLPSPSPAPTEV